MPHAHREHGPPNHDIHEGAGVVDVRACAHRRRQLRQRGHHRCRCGLGKRRDVGDFGLYKYRGIRPPINLLVVQHVRGHRPPLLVRLLRVRPVSGLLKQYWLGGMRVPAVGGGPSDMGSRLGCSRSVLRDARQCASERPHHRRMAGLRRVPSRRRRRVRAALVRGGVHHASVHDPRLSTKHSYRQRRWWAGGLGYGGVLK